MKQDCFLSPIADTVRVDGQVRYTCHQCLVETSYLPPPPHKIRRNCLIRGPGTHLMMLLLALGIKATSCNNTCEELRRRMDAWGVAGCEAHREEILAHLHQAYKTSANLTKLTAGLTALTSHLTALLPGHEPGLPLTLEGLLDEALRRAQRSHHAPP